MVYFGIPYEVDNTKEDKRLEFGGSKGFRIRDESQSTVRKGGKKHSLHISGLDLLNQGVAKTLTTPLVM